MSTLKRVYESVFGSVTKQTLKELQKKVDAINALEPTFEALSEEALKAKTLEFKERLTNGETLDDILEEAFATVREASKRLMKMRHYDVQLIGGMTIHRGNIAEMRTGEGKTLVGTLPTYLNALEGKGVHVITVNDYLAKRDAVWMGQLYDYLGLTVGIIQSDRQSFCYDPSVTGQDTSEGSEIDEARDDMGSFKVQEAFLRPASRQEAYRCDITYGTNNEFGFDYLRDNMVQDSKDMVMRIDHPMRFAVIDEIDSILIDEARTPLIISAPAAKATDQYYTFAKLVQQLNEEEHYNVDEKLRTATLTDEGIKKMESLLGVENIYAEGGIQLVHHLEQALKAHALFVRDRDYMVADGEVMIIDTFTGRKMPGRRYSEGLHQAIEAKEQVEIQRESQTLATITFQNFFLMYDKLAGMTGTAVTEEEEFQKIYNLDVIVIPTNEPDKRIDRPDRIYPTRDAKYRAIAKEVKARQEKGQPVLVGTVSVEQNETLSKYLTQAGVTHQMLNAKNHESEGEIIAQAGRPGSVTLATNIAGRGVDIKLGGVPADPKELAQVHELGGLYVLGSERHESRRIDNQLRGRAARQGDPGETQFYVSAEDDLMRIFGGDRLKAFMGNTSLPDDEPIENKIITKLLESSQKKVEGHHFDSRKHVLEYDQVLNRHRAVIYAKRRHILDLFDAQRTAGPEGTIDPSQIHLGGEEKPCTSLRAYILDLIETEIDFLIEYHTADPERPGELAQQSLWNLQELYETMRTIIMLSEKDKAFMMGFAQEKEGVTPEEAKQVLKTALITYTGKQYDAFEAHIQANLPEGKDPWQFMRELEKGVLLRAIDTLWVDHLVAIRYLRAGIGLRGYGQRDPLIEYKKETFHMFERLLSSIQKEVVYTFFKVGAGLQLAPSIMANDQMTKTGATDAAHSAQGTHAPKKERTEDGEKVGRNDLCPCGSGKKYKKCHGAE